MNISKFTQKSVEAIQNTEKIASEYGNQEIDQNIVLFAAEYRMGSVRVDQDHLSLRQGDIRPVHI